MRRAYRSSRRSFLRATGLSAGLLPLLEADVLRAACVPAARKRLVTLAWGNGLKHWVTGAGAAYQMPAIMQSLEPHRTDLLIPDALFNKVLDDAYPKDQFNNEAHDSPSAQLIGMPMKIARTNHYPVAPAPTPSLDYYIANKLAAGNPTPWPVINLAVMPRRPFWTWQAAGVEATPDGDPYHAFDAIFAGAAMTSDGTAARARLRRKSVLDYVARDIGRFANGLGTADRARIAAHLSSVREIEQRLTVSVPSSCTTPTLAPKFDVQSSDNYEKTLRAQIDIGVAALAAGLTQVLTIQASNGGGTHVNLTWLGYKLGGPYGGDGCCGDRSSHHAAAHDNGAPKDAVDKWFFDQLAYLIGRLKAERGGDGSLFDGSVVLVPNNRTTGEPITSRTCRGCSPAAAAATSPRDGRSRRATRRTPVCWRASATRSACPRMASWTPRTAAS